LEANKFRSQTLSNKYFISARTSEANMSRRRILADEWFTSPRPPEANTFRSQNPFW